MKELDEYFKEYKDVKSRIRELEFKLEEMQTYLYGVSGISYDKLPGTNNTPVDRLPSKIQEKDELNDQIAELEQEKEQFEIKYIDLIKQLSKLKYRTVMRMYYIHDYQIYKIADYMVITVNHAYKIKAEAEKQFLKLIQNDTN